MYSQQILCARFATSNNSNVHQRWTCWCLPARLGKSILRIDRNPLFKRRGRAPDKSTVKRRFRAITVTMRCCNTNVWRHCGTLATFALAAEWFPLVPLLSAVVVWRERAERFHATSTATFLVAFVTPARAVDCSHSPASDRQATAR